MAHHGEEITDQIYNIISWSWDGHGNAPASVSLVAVVEGYPFEYLDRDDKLPAAFLVKPEWPSVIHFPKFVEETYVLQIYVVNELPAYNAETPVYPEEAIRELAYNIRTNLLAAADTSVEAYDLDYPWNLSYIEDVKWTGTFVRDEMQELIDSMGLDLISCRVDFEIQAHGTER